MSPFEDGEELENTQRLLVFHRTEWNIEQLDGIPEFERVQLIHTFF